MQAGVVLFSKFSFFFCFLFSGWFYNFKLKHNREKARNGSTGIYIFFKLNYILCFGKFFADNASLCQSLMFLNVGSEAWRGKSNE
jgi:hypothetical protein